MQYNEAAFVLAVLVIALVAAVAVGIVELIIAAMDAHYDGDRRADGGAA